MGAATRLFAASVDARGGNQARSALVAYLADDGMASYPDRRRMNCAEWP
ncbi:hypothetical protein [Streptomyces sp. WAC 04229]|nr:hypothetical protein [Streptomyces sp. WAC 04229]